jgi:Trk K+ transport system NAD-binding subunit
MKIVVVGNGLAGSKVASKLHSFAQVIIVEQSQHPFYCIGAPRAVVDNGNLN